MHGLQFVVLVAATCLAVASSLPVSDSVVEVAPLADDVNYRLATTVWPSNYNVTLRPYFEKDEADTHYKFDGEVFIEVTPNVQITQATGFELHAKSLTISKSEYWLKTTPTTVLTLTAGASDTTTDIMKLTPSATLAANTAYVLHFEYTGLMGEDMHGFYRSYYVDDNNQTKWLATTQFQTHHARRAFPSFDEPKFKATFDISIVRNETYTSISNTRLQKTTLLESGLYQDTFKTSPIMSTYLVAFIVSEFSKRTDGTFGVYARPQFYGQTSYSFNVGPKILSAMGDYLEFPYYSMTNDKMDMVAIPDFSAGAMENWGLLTYRENRLLVDEDQTSLSLRQAIANVVTHEQAHMWFGDLVTCEWWSYTWLNEGFARYFQYFGTAMVETEWSLHLQFVVDQIQSVMNMDSTVSTNPMTNPDTNSPADLSRMFNSISYNKGATFIRMIEHTMGSDNFKTALRAYLQKYKYQVSLPEYLLEEWQAQWPEDRFKSYSGQIFNSFTTQVGYPVINAKLADDGLSVVFTQKRFLLKENDGADKTLTYTIPISYTTSVAKDFSNTTPKLVLSSDTASLTETFTSKVDWVIANIQETGYYRVNYTETNWHAIHSALKATDFSGIHELNRGQIVDDLLNMARAGEITYELVLDILEYLETETHYIPWTSAFTGFNFLVIRLGTDTAHFSNYIQDLTYKAYNQLGFAEKSTDTALDIHLRTKVLSWACRFGHSDCISQAKGYFSSLSTVPKNLRSVVYCVALREGGTTEYDALYQKFKSATVATEETLIQTSLGCVKSEVLIARVIDLVCTDEIRPQDKSAVLATLYTENNENITPVFKLVTEKFEALAEAMGSYSSVATVIANIAARFTEESQLIDLKTFNTANGSKFGSAASTLTSAEATVEENLAWADAKLGTFRSYLALRNSSATQTAFTAFSLLLLAFAVMLR